MAIGLLIIADLTGYTAYLAASKAGEATELRHLKENLEPTGIGVVGGRA